MEWPREKLLMTKCKMQNLKYFPVSLNSFQPKTCLTASIDRINDIYSTTKNGLFQNGAKQVTRKTVGTHYGHLQMALKCLKMLRKCHKNASKCQETKCNAGLKNWP